MIQILDTEKAIPDPPSIIPLVQQIFRENGWLRKFSKLEYRPQQEQMAIKIAEQLEKGDSHLIEAGTGVGKSLAYLIPGILFSITRKRPFLVSTHTIALQEQIRQKDLVTCRQFFEKVSPLEPFARFKDAMMVGKANYLCKIRLENAIKGQSELFEIFQESELKRIQQWALKTKTGLREELSPPPPLEVWTAINADSSLCSGKRCQKDEFYQQAKNQMQQADIIILNHSLLFSLLNVGMKPVEDTPGILLPMDFLVIDEAHVIPEVATNHLGHSISSLGIDRTLRMLYNPKTSKGILKRAKAEFLKKLVEKTIGGCHNFFENIKDRLLRTNYRIRLTQPHWADRNSLFPLNDLVQELHQISDQIENEALKTELKDQRQRLLDAYRAICECLELGEPTTVYWIEKTGKSGHIIHIRSAPLEVAKTLKSLLFDCQTSCFMTSATLSQSNTLENFQKKSGTLEVSGDLLDSPFNYAKQVKIFTVRGLPEIQDANPYAFLDASSKALLKFIQDNNGGTLILFTSYNDLHYIKEFLHMQLDLEKTPIFAQGTGASRTQIISDFKNHGKAVLLGTDSFWTGVDIPGTALTQLVILRLPFANPHHPVAEARSEWLSSQGKSPFREMTLPDALIKFRQGLGRLIRNHQDHGSIILLDPRILRKSYGKNFLYNLPHPHYKIIQYPELLKNTSSSHQH